jgi:hypothetical protein
MSFTTKKYTRPYLLAELRKLSTRKFKDVDTFVNAFSPRAGLGSAKVAALGRFMSARQFTALFNNGGPANAKKTLIYVVKNS